MKKNNAFRRAAALMAALSITVSLAAPAFADTYYIDYGDITITKNEDGSQTIEQGGDKWTDKAGEETVITTSNTVITTLESDLEGPAAEDSDFGPVVEDNYQPAAPAQQEDAEEPKDDDQPEDDDQKKSTEESEDANRPENAEESEDTDRQKSAEEQESAGQQPQPQQAAPTSVNGKGNGVFGNTITVINNIADKVLNLTLKDVKIDVSDTGDQYDWDQKGKAALSVQGKGNVEIELDGDNELKSGNLKAGLEKNTSEGTLTLKDDNKEAGSLTATGGFNSAGIGGGYWGRGRNITVSGAAQVTAVAGKSDEDNFSGFGATIGDGYNGGDTRDDDGNLISYGSGKEVQADISGLTTTGYIRHMIYNEDGSVKQEWWEYGHLQPDPDTTENPNAPAEGSNGVSLGTPGLHVETLEGSPLPFNAQRQGRTLTVRADTLAARLHGTREALAALQEQGVEQIQFVTSFKTTTLSVEDLLAEGGSWFALEHDGLGSRRLSAAQAESLKCWRH